MAYETGMPSLLVPPVSDTATPSLTLIQSHSLVTVAQTLGGLLPWGPSSDNWRAWKSPSPEPHRLLTPVPPAFAETSPSFADRPT